MSSLILPSMELTSLAVNAELDSLVEATPVQFVDGVDARYRCVSCSLALRQPCQTPCGHRICRSCADQLISAAPVDHPVRCPGNEDDCANLTRTSVSTFRSCRINCKVVNQNLTFLVSVTVCHCVLILPDDLSSVVGDMILFLCTP